METVFRYVMAGTLQDRCVLDSRRDARRQILMNECVEYFFSYVVVTLALGQHQNYTM